MTTSTHETVATTMLSLIAQISPEAWQMIATSGISRSGSEEVEPQPLAPVERVQVTAAAMTHAFARLAIESEIQGRAATQIITDMVDDWCGTQPWTHKWPRVQHFASPETGPRPDDGPIPDPWLTQTGRMVGALVLANIGSRLTFGELRNAMLDGAQRLSDAALTP